jgi:hypothetical protein
MKKVLIIAAVIGLVALIAKKSSSRREEWHGLTESQVRDKLSERLPNRIPEERREVVTDKIVGRMRDRGAIAEDDADLTSVDASDSIDLTNSSEPAETSTAHP